MLTQAQADLLARMRAASHEAGSPFDPAGMWQEFQTQFDDLFRQCDLGCAEAHPYNEHYASHDPANDSYYAFAQHMGVPQASAIGKGYFHACNLLYQILLKKDRWGLLGKVTTALPETASRRIVIDGRPWSWDVLISLDSLLYIAAAWPRILEGPCLVADLGAGWGRMGFVLKQVNPQATYVIFDLPESLLISSTYLPTVMPREKFHLYDDTRGMALERDEGVWCLPAQDLARVPDDSIDCFINIFMLQEIPDSEVDAYTELINRKVSGIFYALQTTDRYFSCRWPIPSGHGCISWYWKCAEYIYEIP